MSRDPPSKLNAQISEEAAEWFVEFRTGDIDAAGRQRFDRWVRTSPEHLRAYLEIAAIWSEREALQARHGAELPADLLLANAARNVVDLPASAASGAPLATAAASGSKKRRSVALAASLATLIVILGAFMAYQMTRAGLYATEVGEQRSVRLLDGSTIELNSRSAVRVHLSRTERRIELLAGQALFHVAKDRARPFIVRSDGVQIRAVGTQFDVNRKRVGMVVTVLEGRVAVSNASAARAAASVTSPAVDLSLGAGEQVTVSALHSSRPVRTNVSEATAWTQHQLVLNAAPLAEVAEEFNRYSARTLVVEDLGRENLRLSGVFSTDPDFLLRYLRERPDITLRETDTEIYITRHE